MMSRIVRVLKLLFTPLAFGFLIYFAWQSRVELADLAKNASLVCLGLAVLVWAVLHAVTPLLAVLTLDGCGSTVSWQRAFSIHAARIPARYLPGGIWHTVGRVMDYRELGIAGRRLTAFVVLENGLAAVFTLAVGGAIVYGMRSADQIGMIAGLASVASIIAIPILIYVINSRILVQPDRLSGLAFVKSAVIVAVFWFGATASFLLYLNAFPASTGDYSIVEMAGIYLFSWGVGFISIFAPQGIGVFEVVASELIDGPIGLMGLAALIAGFRVVVLVADIVVWLVFLAMTRDDSTSA